MTIDQIIALSASVGTCLSAIATFLTVRQMIQQRQVLYRPELVISRTSFEGSKASIAKFSLFNYWVLKPDAEVEGERPPMFFMPFFMPLRNVGLGAAKNISVKWSFPIEEMVSQLNDLAQRTLTPANFALEDGDLIIKSESLGNGISDWVNQRQDDSLGYVLPVTVQREPVHLSLPMVFTQLCSFLMFLSMKDKDQLSIPTVPAINVRLEYLDIGDKFHVAVFDIKVQVSAVGGDGRIIHGELESKKCAQHCKKNLGSAQ